MELTGKITQLLAPQSGEGKNGKWEKQEYVIETSGSKFPKSVCVAVWNEKIGEFGLKIGDEVTASIEIESREFNGKWYTNVQAWKVEKRAAAAAVAETKEDLLF
jgi:hypothetical protein